MNQTFSKKEKSLLLIRIMWPILITQLAIFGMNFFDTLMTGQYNSSHLAGVAIGSSIWVPIAIGLGGILVAVTPIVAQLNGGGKREEVAPSVFQGLYAALLMALIVYVLGMMVLNPALNVMNLEPIVEDVARNYVLALSIGLIPLFLYNVLRAFMDALGMTKITMVISLIALPINVVLNYLLIFGYLGLPELGGVGAGYASAVTYWILLCISIFVIHRKEPFSSYGIFKKVVPFDLIGFTDVFKIGIPIGLSIFFETSIFSAVTLFMSDYSTQVIAGHQAALNFSSLLYMIPLSMAMALTIVVGFEVGAKRYADAKTYSWMGVIAAIFLAFIYGLFLFLGRHAIGDFYVNDPEVSSLIAHFLLYAVFFQLSDAIQAPVQGALRGYKDVNITFIMALISYWVIGLPLGYILANYTALEPFGYWVGLTAGLTAGAITLSLRLRWLQKKLAVESL